MPRYELRCKDCGHEFNKNLSFSERKGVICEECGSKKIEQVFKSCNTLVGKTGISNKASCSRQGGCGGCTGCR